MMNRRLAWVGCAFALTAGSLATAFAAEPARLTAEQIIENNAAARGGLARWRAVNAITMTGQIDAGGKKDVKLPFTSTLQRPNKSRLEIRFHDQTALQVYDGKQGWKLRPYLNRDEVEPYTAAEARSAADWDELDGPLIDHARKGISVEVAGVEPVEGKPAYKLKLTNRDGRQRFLWVDAASFLEVRIDGEPRKLDGKLHDVTVYYRNYKPVDGLMLPYELETAVDGVSSRRKMTLQTVKLNPILEAAAFARPQLALIRSVQ
jgi:hypothetical protein